MTDTQEWTEEEAAVVEAAKRYFEAIALCELAGGRTQPAILAAMPAEVREQMPGLSMQAALEAL